MALLGVPLVTDGQMAGVHYPRCVAGKPACPPEDCGGRWSYADVLDAIQEPEHGRQEKLLGWVGGEFDAEAFGIEAVNDKLDNVPSARVLAKCKFRMVAEVVDP
jgi:hypothetical protein